jgi:hypothetical protein
VGVGVHDALFLELEQTREVTLLRHLDVCLTLSLGVLETAVEKKNARLLNASAHFRVRHILAVVSLCVRKASVVQSCSCA